MKKLEWKACLAMAVLILGFLAVPAQAIDFDGDGVDDRAWVESLSSDSTDSDSDFAAGIFWVLQCPPGCPKVRTVNHHGEVNEFCDCNGDGQPDEACQIWLKTWADGSQKPICHLGCPGEGQPGGQECTEFTAKKPSGGITMWCGCT